MVRHQPYNSHAPRTTFLQLGEVRVHRSELDTKEFAGMTKEERILVTTYTEMKEEVDKMKHIMDPNLRTDPENEMKVWGYLMMQYNLKPGLRKFGTKEASAAIDELMQLRIMDMLTAMDPLKSAREDKGKVLCCCCS